MLYKLSLRSANDKIALAKFSLQLLDRYYFLKTKSLTVEGKFRANIKFLRNCTLLIVKSQSNYYLRAIQRLFAGKFGGSIISQFIPAGILCGDLPMDKYVGYFILMCTGFWFKRFEGA